MEFLPLFEVAELAVISAGFGPFFLWKGAFLLVERHVKVEFLVRRPTVPRGTQ